MKRRRNYFLLAVASVVASTAFAQQVSTGLDDMGLIAVNFSQRAIQYELLLDSKLSQNAAICLDEKFRNTWFLPSGGQTVVAERAIGRLRQAYEGCLASLASKHESSRFVNGELSKLARQLEGKQVLEAKLIAQDCLVKFDAETDFKKCIATSFPTAQSAEQISKWNSLFQRRPEYLSLYSKSTN